MCITHSLQLRRARHRGLDRGFTTLYASYCSRMSSLCFQLKIIRVTESWSNYHMHVLACEGSGLADWLTAQNIPAQHLQPQDPAAISAIDLLNSLRKPLCKGHTDLCSSRTFQRCAKLSTESFVTARPVYGNSQPSSSLNHCLESG